jgi:hypothetical protein
VENTLTHLAAIVRARRYVPGIVTALTLYLPLGAAAYRAFARTSLVTHRTVAGA